MLSKDIKFKNFKGKKINKSLKIFLKNLIDKKNDKNNLINSFTTSYLYSFNKKKINKYRKFNNYEIYGMGGSSLGAEAIYNFMKYKIKKKFYFFNNLDTKNHSIKNKKKSLNIIISKSGNTLETIINLNTNYNAKNKNIFITENTENYLQKLANKLKSDVIEHPNFIGGRFSVMSEVGMLPAQLMGLDPKKFKRFNDLIFKKKFLDNLINNVINTYSFTKKKMCNSVILNYDEHSEDLFKWYQQLVSESLGKKSKGILPVISCMPKDNHSVLQLYLSGFKPNFYTFFIVEDKNSLRLNSKYLLDDFKFLKQKNAFDILNSQRISTQNIFKKKNIPFRSFYIKKRNEETLGELFCFFTLETILLSHLLMVNPLNQPEVESIKKETFRILKN